jgi:hypothetical protein
MTMFRARVIPCGICGGQSGIGTGFFFSQYFGFPLPLLFNKYSILIFICGQSLKIFQKKWGSGFKVFVLWLSTVINWFDFMGRQLLIQTALLVACIAHEYQR